MFEIYSERGPAAVLDDSQLQSIDHVLMHEAIDGYISYLLEYEMDQRGIQQLVMSRLRNFSGHLPTVDDQLDDWISSPTSSYRHDKFADFGVVKGRPFTEDFDHQFVVFNELVSVHVVRIPQLARSFPLERIVSRDRDQICVRDGA